MPIRIRAMRDGFRRAGLAHPAAWTDHADDAFSPEQAAALEAEPMLVVERVAAADPEPGPAPGPQAGPASEPEPAASAAPVIDAASAAVLSAAAISAPASTPDAPAEATKPRKRGA
jgi:hypothetical protein